MTFTACSSSDDGPDTPPQTPAPQLTLSTDTESVTIDETGLKVSIAAPAEGLTAHLAVTATDTEEWTLSEIPEWVGATKTADGISFAVEANESTDSRTAKFTITATNESGTAEAQVELFQDGIVIPEPELAFSSDSEGVAIDDNGLSATVTAAAEGAAVAINVSTNVAAPVIGKTDEWIGVAYENSVLTLTVAPNPSTEVRSSELFVTAENQTGVIEGVIRIAQAGVAAAELTLSESSIAFAGEGSEKVVEFTTNQPSIEIAAPEWLAVAKSDKSFTLTAAANATGAARSGEVIVTAGTGDNTATAKIEVSQERPASALTFVIAATASSKKLTLPTLSTADAEVAITVEWGDGSEAELFTAGLTSSNSHEYAAEGEYTVTITSDNKFTAFQFYNNARLKAIVKNSLDMSGVKTLSRCFYNDRALESVPAGMFEGSIATNFNSIFNGSGIKALPARCFANCAAVSEMKNICTGCKQMESIAGDAFEGCTKVNTFYNAFSNCESLKEIPATIFASCTGLEELDYCFQRCTSLTKLPASMFDNNRSIRWMEYCFQRCENLTGESPYTMLDGTKVHLYEREYYPEQFKNPSSHDYCFSYDELMDDYATMKTAGWAQ